MKPARKGGFPVVSAARPPADVIDCNHGSESATPHPRRNRRRSNDFAFVIDVSHGCFLIVLQVVIQRRLDWSGFKISVLKRIGEGDLFNNDPCTVVIFFGFFRHSSTMHASNLFKPRPKANPNIFRTKCRWNSPCRLRITFFNSSGPLN